MACICQNGGHTCNSSNTSISRALLGVCLTRRISSLHKRFSSGFCQREDSIRQKFVWSPGQSCLPELYSWRVNVRSFKNRKPLSGRKIAWFSYLKGVHLLAECRRPASEDPLLSRLWIHPSSCCLIADLTADPQPAEPSCWLCPHYLLNVIIFSGFIYSTWGSCVSEPHGFLSVSSKAPNTAALSLISFLSTGSAPLV